MRQRMFSMLWRMLSRLGAGGAYTPSTCASACCQAA